MQFDVGLPGFEIQSFMARPPRLKEALDYLSRSSLHGIYIENHTTIFRIPIYDVSERKVVTAASCSILFPTSHNDHAEREYSKLCICKGE